MLCLAPLLWCPSLSRPEGRWLIKFRVQQYRIDARKYFFSSRVVTIWNQLRVEIFNVVTAAAFAAGLRSCNLSHYLLGSK